jgi:hypothetical protein
VNFTTSTGLTNTIEHLEFVIELYPKNKVGLVWVWDVAMQHGTEKILNFIGQPDACLVVVGLSSVLTSKIQVCDLVSNKLLN